MSDRDCNPTIHVPGDYPGYYRPLPALTSPPRTYRIQPSTEAARLPELEAGGVLVIENNSGRSITLATGGRIAELSRRLTRLARLVDSGDRPGAWEEAREAAADWLDGEGE